MNVMIFRVKELGTSDGPRRGESPLADVEMEPEHDDLAHLRSLNVSTTTFSVMARGIDN